MRVRHNDPSRVRETNSSSGRYSGGERESAIVFREAAVGQKQGVGIGEYSYTYDVYTMFIRSLIRFSAGPGVELSLGEVSVLLAHGVQRPLPRPRVELALVQLTLLGAQGLEP